MIEREKLIPVTSEKQLRPGLMIELRACEDCGAPRHRMLLLRKETPAEASEAICDAHGTACIGWLTSLAHPGCAYGWCFSGPDRSIADGRLFIVNPFQDTETPVKAARPRPLERVR